jgi:hypothetical protein
MFDVITMFWICVGISYSVLFIADAKLLKKRRATP